MEKYILLDTFLFPRETGLEIAINALRIIAGIIKVTFRLQKG